MSGDGPISRTLFYKRSQSKCFAYLSYTKDRVMKNTFVIFTLLLSLLRMAVAQPSPRAKVNFDHGWELYRINRSNDGDTGKSGRRGTSWNSQFNDQHIQSREGSTSDITKRETGRAIKAFVAEYPKIKTLKWEKVSLPCAARIEQKLNPGKNQFVGICYYRKRFRIPDSLRDKRLSLLFEGAMQVASVWVNGKFVLQHQGGYLPFIVPLNGYVKAGMDNEIIVRVDNRDNPDTPPGKPLAGLGFLYWSGIYRDAWLIATDSIHFTDAVTAGTIAGGGIFVRYERVSSCSATAVIKTQLKNDGTNKPENLTVEQIVSDTAGDIISRTISNTIMINAGEKKEIQQRMVVPDPRLWSPDDPCLYRLTTEIWTQSRLVDKCSQLIGIRSLSYSRWAGFKLNGKPLRLVGTNRHQDRPFIGNALSDRDQYRDLKRIKEAGMNFVRLSHYPNDPAVYNICDSLGLMVLDAIPGWQFFNNDAVFKKRVFRDIRQMIRRDRNHPCVVMWEVSLNESYPPDSFRIKSALIAHQEYPGDQLFTSGDVYGARKTAWDVPYNGWKAPFGRPQNVQPERPGFVREYGDYEFGGAKSTTRVNRSDGEKALLQNAWNFQWEHNLLRSPQYYPWTVGDANWAFYDGFEAFSDSTSDWGVMDVYRIPKFSYYFFRSQMDPYRHIHGAANKPMVFIANWWTPRDTSGKVVVYSNCDEVALYVNGRMVKKQKPDDGPNTPYGDYDKGGHPFDGGNCKYLPHPPFTFRHIHFKAGALKAVGYIRGKGVTEQTRRTPGNPADIQLYAVTEGKPLAADGADAVFVYAKITDKNGTVDFDDNKTYVTFHLKGNARIAGPSKVKVRGGIAAVLLQAGNLPGDIVIQAQATGLKSQAFRIRSTPQTDASGISP
jgi:beta-galactosidase